MLHPLRSRIAYYYNAGDSRHHQCVSIWRSIACESASINFKKQKRVVGFWEACNVFWLIYYNSRTHVVSGSRSGVFVYGKSKYDVILPIPCSTKEENCYWRNYFRKQRGCVFNVATHVLDKIAQCTSTCAQEYARDLARHKHCSVKPFMCDNCTSWLYDRLVIFLQF